MKKIMIFGILISFLMVLGSCQLAQNDIVPTEQEDDKLDDKHLEGIYLQIRDSESETVTKLLPEYGEEGAVYLLNATIYNHETSTSIFRDESYGFINVNQKINIHHDTVDDITTKTITLDTQASLIFSPVVAEKIVDLIPIFTGDERPTGDGTIGHMMNRGSSVESKFQDEYEIDGVFYIIKFTISFSIIDELTEVNIIEMSDEHIMIQSTRISEPVSTFETSTETAYVVIEEVYKNSQNERYTKRTIYDRGKNHSVSLHFFNHPLMIINDQKLHISFKS